MIYRLGLKKKDPKLIEFMPRDLKVELPQKIKNFWNKNTDLTEILVLPKKNMMIKLKLKKKLLRKKNEKLYI